MNDAVVHSCYRGGREEREWQEGEQAPNQPFSRPCLSTAKCDLSTYTWEKKGSAPEHFDRGYRPAQVQVAHDRITSDGHRGEDTCKVGMNGCRHRLWSSGGPNAGELLVPRFPPDTIQPGGAPKEVYPGGSFGKPAVIALALIGHYREGAEFAKSSEGGAQEADQGRDWFPQEPQGSVYIPHF